MWLKFIGDFFSITDLCDNFLSVFLWVILYQKPNRCLFLQGKKCVNVLLISNFACSLRTLSLQQFFNYNSCFSTGAVVPTEAIVNFCSNKLWLSVFTCFFILRGNDLPFDLLLWQRSLRRIVDFPVCPVFYFFLGHMGDFLKFLTCWTGNWEPITYFTHYFSFLNIHVPIWCHFSLVWIFFL